MHHRLVDTRINSYANSSTSVEKMVKIGPVVFELNIGGESENCAVTWPKFDDHRPFSTLAF